MPSSETKTSFLEFLPASLFGSVMGLTGLSFCWEWAEKVWGFAPWIKNLIGGLAILVFLLLSLAYLLKWAKYPALVAAEFQHPVSISFFATIIISLLLLPGILLPYSKNLAIGVWATGAAGMFVFAWIVLRKWLDHQQDPANAVPAWILPIVGTLDVPIVGAHLPIPGVREICLVFFGIGLIFGMILLTIILSRLLFHPPLPAAVQPTLMILIGPFALAFSGYEALTTTLDITASVFYYFDLFLLLLLGSKIFLLPKCCPFRVTWWAVSFPLVAITIAAFRYAGHRQSHLFQLTPAILLVVSTGVIGYLLIQTIYRLLTNKLFLVNPAAEKATRQLEPAPVKGAPAAP